MLFLQKNCLTATNLLAGNALSFSVSLLCHHIIVLSPAKTAELFSLPQRRDTLLEL